MQNKWNMLPLQNTTLAAVGTETTIMQAASIGTGFLHGLLSAGSEYMTVDSNKIYIAKVGVIKYVLNNF